MKIIEIIFRLLPIVERLAGAWIESDNLKRKAEIERLKKKVAKLEDQLRIKKAASQAALDARKRREAERIQTGLDLLVADAKKKRVEKEQNEKVD
jgi:hypothetical protein